MKDEKKKHIKTVAEQIVKLEKQCKSGTDVSKFMNEMEQLVQGLSLEDMLEIDNYIISKKLLTK